MLLIRGSSGLSQATDAQRERGPVPGRPGPRSLVRRPPPL